MAAFKRRQPSDYNQSVPESQPVPETHAYQEKHFQPTLNQPVSENHSETEYGSTVTPDQIETRDDKSPRSTFTESSDQPGEDDLLNQQVGQNLQGNSDAGTQYSTPDVSSGVTSGPGGFTTYDPGTIAAASTTTAASTVVATSTVASVSSIAVTTAGAAIIAATLILPLIIGVPSAIIFEDVSVTDTTVYYSIYFEDYEEDMDLTVCLHNNFTNRTHVVESESISVMEEGLKPNVRYKLTVYGSMGTVLDEITVTTEKSSEPPEPTPEPKPELDVAFAEFNTSDGLIHLSATLDDPKGACSGFKAVFYDETDGKHVPVRTIDILNFDSEITMDAGLASDTSINGKFTVECTLNGSNTVMFEKEITAYGAPYFGFAARPTITDGTATVECIIVDPAGTRTDYHWMFYTKEDTDYDVSKFSDDGAMTGSSFTVTGVPTYAHQSFFIKVSWEETGGTGDMRTLEYKTYDSPVTVDLAGMYLDDMGGGSFALEVPITVNDPDGIWTELEMVLGDATYSSTYYGSASVMSFSSSDTLITIPVTDAGLYGMSVPLTVRNGRSATLDTFPEFVAGPTMSVGFATMNRVDVTIGATTYETRFDVEINDLVDDLHYLTDASGNWTLMPMLEATDITPPGGEMTAMSVTKVGTGSYIASFYAENWNESMMYRYNDTFTAAGVSKDYVMAFVNEDTYEVYTTRSMTGDIMAYVTVTTKETVDAAKAVSGSTEITATVTNPYTDCYRIELNLTTADPYAEYRIYLYDRTDVRQSCVDMTFPYPKLIEGSAVYHTSTGTATVQFEFTKAPIYMPDYFESGDTTDGILTLTFSVDASSPVLTGEEYFRFVQSDRNPDYYWYTTFRIED